MPTKHRRIAVIEDPELAEALKRASYALPGLSDAALVKELTLRGAKSLTPSSADERMARIIARTGASPARGNIAEYLRNRPLPGRVDENDPYALSRALDEQREDRL